MTARIIVLSFPGSEGFLAEQDLDRAASRAAHLRTGAGPMAMGTPGERHDRRGFPIRGPSRSHRNRGRADSERKSVVSGKSVSGRVERRGGRILKKKMKEEETKAISI